MIYFTKYADNKFDILNKHKIYFTREQIEEVINNPDKVSRKKNCFGVEKESIKVIYKKEEDVLKIITFYPIK